jgi:hypothetical protein
VSLFDVDISIGGCFVVAWCSKLLVRVVGSISSGGLHNLDCLHDHLLSVCCFMLSMLVMVILMVVINMFSIFVVMVIMVVVVMLVSMGFSLFILLFNSSV